jgi:hypothetical protein
LPIQITAGGKTFPKKGRLGSGAYWPASSPIPGNIFGPNNDVPMTPTSPTEGRKFGSPSNAGNGTQFGQNRVTLGAGLPNPNAGQNNVTQQNKVPSFTYSATTTGMNVPQSPFGAQNAPVIQPHERNSLPTRKVFGIHRTASGASRLLPSDTPFHPIAVAQKAKPPIRQQTNVLNVVRTSHPASFISRNNLWTDPNGSFMSGHTNVNGEVGRGRWTTVKRGAAG